MRRIEISLCFVMKLFILAIVWAYLIGTVAWSNSISESSWVEVVNHFVNVSGAAGGICSVVESTDADLPSSLAKQGSFIVQCLYKNRQECNEMRKQIRSLGLYGKVSAETYENGHLPYTQNLINIVVVDSYPLLANEDFRIEEVKRVLTPLGTAFIGTSSDSELKAKWIDKLKKQL